MDLQERKKTHLADITKEMKYIKYGLFEMDQHVAELGKVLLAEGKEDSTLSYTDKLFSIRDQIDELKSLIKNNPDLQP